MEERYIPYKEAISIINKQESHFWDFKSASGGGKNVQEIASALANEFNEAADPVHRASLIALGLVLFVLTLLVLAASRVLIARLARGEGART